VAKCSKSAGAGEAIDVRPGGWHYTAASVKMTPNVQGINTGLFGSMSFITKRFTEPSRLGIQSVCPHMPTME
jgi:hypothetical protein